MTQAKLVNAYKALTHLAVQSLPVRTAYALYKLRRAILPVWEFQREQESALIEKYEGVIEETSIQFPSPEAAAAYQREMAELGSLEAEEVHLPPVPVVPLTDNIMLSVTEIEALDGLVAFEEEPYDA